MNHRGPLVEKSFQFAIDIVFLYKELIELKREFVMSKQLLRCGTAVGSQVREAQNAESKKDFVHKMAISQKNVTNPNIGLNYSMRLDTWTKKNLIICSRKRRNS